MHRVEHRLWQHGLKHLPRCRHVMNFVELEFFRSGDADQQREMRDEQIYHHGDRDSTSELGGTDGFWANVFRDNEHMVMDETTLFACLEGQCRSLVRLCGPVASGIECVRQTDSYGFWFERIWISRVTNGRSVVSPRLWQFCHIARARDPVRCRDKSIGIEMISRHCFVFTFLRLVSLQCSTVRLLRANPRRRSGRRQERSAPRCRTFDQPDQCRRWHCSATKSFAPALDSAARLVMSDSTNLSLGANASLKLDRTVFDDEPHYRDVAVRLDLRRVPLRHRQFGKGRLQDHDAARDHRRPRHHPRYPVAARPDHRQSAGRRGRGLHASASNASS